LLPLCDQAGAAFFRETVTGIDLVNRRILFGDRMPIRFDVLSLDIGSTPKIGEIPGVREFALPIKPIERFLASWEDVISRILSGGSRTWRLATVGGGAGGVELTLSAQFRLSQLIQQSGKRIPAPQFTIVTASESVLPTHNRRVQAKFERILKERGISLRISAPVIQVKSDHFQTGAGDSIGFDHLFWVTHASAPKWLAESGLATDPDGFLAVNQCLQSISDPSIFAAGDIASMQAHPRPKSGVFAVRQGPPLAQNLRRALRPAPLISFVPQREFLSLISTGDKYAVASRGPWAFEGRYVWRLKEWIDRNWMSQYQTLST
jgi:selenide,water dikinase